MGSLCGSNTQTVVQQSQPPASVLANYNNLVGQAQSLSQLSGSLPGQPVAPLNQEQYSGINTINAAAGPQTQAYYDMGSSAMGSGLGTVGSALSYLPEASGAVGAGLGTLSSALPYYGTGANLVGESTVNPITSGAINSYMSPYLSDVVGATENQFNNQNAIQANQLTGSAIMGGNAFGGDRAGVAQGVLAGQQQSAEAPVIAGLENSGYTSAVQEAEQQQGLLQSAGSLYGSLGSGVAGVGTAEGGLGSIYGSLANTEGSLGATQAGIGSQIASLGPSLASTLLGTGSAQLGAGATEQAEEQAQENSQYQQMLNQEGFTGLNLLAPIVEGTGSLSGGTGTTTSPGPSAISQIAGLGTSALALNNLTGGGVTSGLSSLGTTAAAGLGSLSTGVSASELAAETGEDIGTATEALALGARRGGRVHYDDGGSVDDDDDVEFGVNGTQPAQSQSNPGLGGIVGYDALTRALSQGSAGNQVASALTGTVGFADGGTPNAQPLNLSTLLQSQNSGIPGPMGTTMPRGMGPPGLRMGMGPPQPPGASHNNNLNNILSEVQQAAHYLKPQTGSASGGRIAGLGRLKFADGGGPDFDQDFSDVGNAGSGSLTLSDLLASKGISAPQDSGGANVPLPTPRPAAADAGDAGMDALPQNAAPTMGAQNAGLGALQSAVFGQESNYGRNSKTSSTGAAGPMQIEPGTFAQYAVPGEKINNPDDNKAVGNRILADYYQRYGGDPGRAAVAYFSGPGNVAPAGSPTPWLRNVADPTGKTTSSYVSDVVGRLNGAQSDRVPQSGIAITSPIASPASASPAIGKPNPWEAVLAAGLGMMAGQSPFALSNIGQGGLAGLKNYQEQQSELREEATTQQGAQRLAQEAAVQQAQLKNETARLAQQKEAEERPYQQLTAAQQAQLQLGKVPPGYTMQNGNLVAMPGGPADPNAVKALSQAKREPKAVSPGQSLVGPDGKVIYSNESGLMNDAAVNLAVDRIVAGDPSALQNLGRGAQTGQNLTRIQNALGEKATNEGWTGAQLAAARANFASQSAAAKVAATRETNVQSAIEEAKNTFPLALDASANLPRSQFVPWNKAVQMVQSGTSSPELARYVTSLRGAITAYSQAMSRTGTNSVYAQGAAEHLLDQAQGPESIKATLGQMRKEMDAAVIAPETVRQAIMSRIGGGKGLPNQPQQQQQQTAPATTPQAPPVAGAKLYQGKWYTRGPNGEAVPVQ